MMAKYEGVDAVRIRVTVKDPNVYVDRRSDDGTWHAAGAWTIGDARELAARLTAAIDPTCVHHVGYWRGYWQPWEKKET